MKKTLTILFFLICSGVGIFFALHPSSNQQSQQIKLVPRIQIQKPEVPITLLIPKINLTTPIEAVGQDQQGRMDVPKNPQDTGWYDLGFKPGEKGSAVIDGHLDTVTGAPAAFWSLAQLQTGDHIFVIDAHHTKYSFVISREATYDYDKVPLQQIFATVDKPRLNLITCRGVFDKKTKNYSKRIVIFAEE